MADIVEIIIKASDQSGDAFKQLQDNLDKSNKKGLDLTGTFKGLGIAALALGAAFVGGIVAATKLSYDAAMQFADSLELVNRLVGISGDEAAAFAASMQFVGMSVEEGTAGLAIFARNAQGAKDSMKTAGASFRESMSDLVAANKDAVGAIRDTWKTAQSDAASQSAQVWQDFFEKAKQAQQDLAKSIQRSTEDAERNKSRSLEDLNLTTAERMGKARTLAEKRAILMDDAQQRAKIDRDFKRKQEDIALEKKRREQDLADREAADRQAAERQTAIIAENLKKQEAQYNEHLAKQEASFTRSADKLKAILSKANVSSPFQKALDSLHLSLSQVMSDTGEINFMPILEALNKMPEGAAKMQTMMELFGRGGIKFAEWVENAAASTAMLSSVLKEFGVDTSKGAVDAAMELQRAFNLTGIEIQAIFTAIGQQLIPIIKPLVDLINTQILPAFSKWAQSIMPDVKNFLTDLTDAIKTGNWDKVKTNLGVVAQKIGDLLGAAMQGVIQGATWIAGVMGTLVGELQRWVNSPSGQSATIELTRKLGDLIARGLIEFVKTSVQIAAIMAELSLQLIMWSSTPDAKLLFKSISDAFIDGFVVALMSSFKMKGDTGLAIALIKALMGGGIGDLAKYFMGSSSAGGFQTAPGQSRMIPGGFNQPVPILAHGGEIIGRPGNGNSSSPDLVIVGFDRNAYQTFLQPYIEKGILTARSRQIGATA